jgi:hypothetical protein
MKNKKVELIRVQNLLENDRLNIGDGFNELFRSDLQKLLIDYFDIKKNPELKIVKNNNGFNINITFESDRIKFFNCLNDC